MSQHRFEHTHVARIPTDVVGREPHHITQLRALLQGLGDAIVNFTENDDPDTSRLLEELLGGGTMKLASGSSLDNCISIEIAVAGNPLNQNIEMTALNNGEAISYRDARDPDRLEEIVRNAGFDPDDIGAIKAVTVDPFAIPSLDPVELDELDA